MGMDGFGADIAARTSAGGSRTARLASGRCRRALHHHATAHALAAVGQPSRSYLVSELVRLTGSGSGAVQRELERLVACGLVTVTALGRQKLHRANPDSPVFAELRGLVVKTVALAEPLRGALEPLMDRITLALIYGSVAHGTAMADSDVDLLVVADHLTLEELYSALASAEATLMRQINPTPYTESEFAARKAAGMAFVSRVLAGDHMVIVGSTDE